MKSKKQKTIRLIKIFLGFMLLIISVTGMVISIINTSNKIVIDYDDKTDIVTVLSDKDINKLTLNFLTHTEEFGDKKETLVLREIKANIKTTEKFKSEYENSDVTITSKEFINYDKLSEFIFYLSGLLFCFSVIFLIYVFYLS